MGEAVRKRLPEIGEAKSEPSQGGGGGGASIWDLQGKGHKQLKGGE